MYIKPFNIKIATYSNAGMNMPVREKVNLYGEAIVKSITV